MKHSFHSRRTVKRLRKARRCNGCGTKMEVGQSASIMAGVFEGDFFSSYLCDPCNQFLDDNTDFGREGWYDGDIGDARRERDEHVRLRPKARERD